MDNISAFFDAIKHGDRSAAEELLASDPSLLLARSEGLSPVLAAAYYQEPEIAAWLVEMGAPLDIFEACAAGSEARVEQLLNEEPGLLNAFAADGFQPLGLAAFFGHAALVKLLLERGAEPSTPSRNGMGVTPLHSAAAGRRLEVARLLVEGGADVNARSAEGFTPLHSASENGDEELVRLLLSYGADSHAASDDGKTPADLALEKGHEQVIELLD